LGFIVSSDHLSTQMSFAIVYAEDATKEGSYSATKRRRTHGAADSPRSASATRIGRRHPCSGWIPDNPGVDSRHQDNQRTCASAQQRSRSHGQSRDEPGRVRAHRPTIFAGRDPVLCAAATDQRRDRAVVAGLLDPRSGDPAEWGC